MHVRRAMRAMTFASLIAALAACGATGGASGSDPAGTVQAAYAAIGGGDIAKVTDFVCAAKKDDVLTALGNGGAAQFEAAGVKPADFLAAMGISFSDLVVTQTARTDSTATVTVTGKQKINIDQAKMRAIMKSLLAAQGKPTDDATVDLVMNAMSAQMTQVSTISSTVHLVSEGGKWLICGDG